MMATPKAALLLQVHQGASSGTELVLSAWFAQTIAFYIWHRLKQEQYPDSAALSFEWQDTVQQLVHHFKDVFSVGRSAAECAAALEKLYCHIASTGPLVLLTTPFRPSQGFTAVPKPEEVLRYAVDKLMVSARKIRRQDACLPPESAEEEGSYPAFWQSSDVDSTASQLTGVVQTQTDTCLLQSILVLWKLAWIAGCLSRTVQTPETDIVTKTLFYSIGGLSEKLKTYDRLAAEGLTGFPPQAATNTEAGTTGTEAESNKQLSLMLVTLIKDTVPVVMGSDNPDRVRFHVMSALMMKSQPATYQAVAKAIVAGGRVAASRAQSQHLMHISTGLLLHMWQVTTTTALRL